MFLILLIEKKNPKQLFNFIKKSIFKKKKKMLKVNKINSNDVMKHKLKLGLSDRKICFRHTENFPNPVGLYNADGAEKFSYSFQTTIEDKSKFLIKLFAVVKI